MKKEKIEKVSEQSFTATLSKVSMEGRFSVFWSEEILEVVKERVIAKNAVQARVIWMNEEIISGREDIPKYSVRLLDVTTKGLDFKI